jgi:large subunit ribosomal protein L4
VLSEHARRGSLGIVDVGQYDTPSTKTAFDALGKFGEGRALVVVAPEGEDTTVKSFRNMRGVEVKPCNRIGVADIIGAPRLVLSQAALDYLTQIARKPEREEAAA